MKRLDNKWLTPLIFLFIFACIHPSLTLGQEPTNYSSNRLFTDDLSDVRVFGSSFFAERTSEDIQMSQNKPVPEDYILGPGDEFRIKVRGIVNEVYQVEINFRGVLSIANIPSIYIAGMSLKEAREEIKELVLTNYKNVDVEIEIIDLKNIDVIVTGNVRKPGVYTIRGNSTFLDIMYLSGGPTRSGTFRRIELNRTHMDEEGSGEIEQKIIDLYDVFIYGKHSPFLLQSGDRINIPEVGYVATIFGEVKHPAQYEWSESLSLQELVRLSGGFTPNAAVKHIEVSRIQEFNGFTFFNLDYTDSESQQTEIRDGDIIKIPDGMEIARRDNVIVNIDGRVNYPGRYILPKDSTLSDLIESAGGLKKDAFLPGTKISRSSLKSDQENVQQKVIKDLESQIMRIQAELAENAVLSDDQKLLMKAQSLRQNILESQGSLLFEGRLIFNPSEEDPLLHQGDKVQIPTEPNVVSVIGAVFNSGSYTYHEDWSIENYLNLGGGTTPFADEENIYVIKSYGHVISSKKQESDFQIEKGDIIVVPMEYQQMVPQMDLD